MASLKTRTLAVPAAVAAGAGLPVDDLGRLGVFISGTFSATVQIQAAAEDVAASYVNVGAALTAPGVVEVTVPRGFVRANVTVYASGTPAGKVVGESAPLGG